MLPKTSVSVAGKAKQRVIQTALHLKPAQTHNMASISAPTKKHKVAVVGSGNWGSTVAKIVAENTKEHPDLFEEDVQMWVFDEDVTIPKTSKHYPGDAAKPEKLTSLINKYHENFKYLPNITLPTNLVANPSVEDTVEGASILIFNLPHQFIGKITQQMRGHILPFARGISCIKGVNVTDSGASLFSETIGKGLGIYVGALSGANLATEIAKEKWSETTIAYDPPMLDSRTPTPRGPSPQSSSDDLNALQHRDVHGEVSPVKLTPLPSDYPPIDHALWHTLFHRQYFHVRVIHDVAGVSLGGALKNVVALAAGFVDGRGWGDNAKSAVMRVGLLEMVKFGKDFFAETVDPATFLEESAGMADLITSCSGGRNHKCAKMSVEEGLPINEIEKRELNGQKLQGTSTAYEVYSFLNSKGVANQYPLFTAVYNILEGNNTVDDIPDLISKPGE